MAMLLPQNPSQVHAAAVNGDKNTLQRLISAESRLRDSEDQFGRTPLMYCVLADRLDCAEVLLKAGAAVNNTDHSQRTALHLAAQKGNVRFMKLLLSRHADWRLKDLEEMTPLHLATRHSSSKPLSLLLKHMAPGEVDTQDRNKSCCKSLPGAYKAQGLVAVLTLCVCEVTITHSLHAKDVFHRREKTDQLNFSTKTQTALHWSAFYNHPEHVKLLIKHDSNIGIPDSEGKIPLHWAAHNKHPNATRTVRCILEAAPTESLLNWQDYEGRTPLHFAVADGNEAVVEVLTSYEGCSVTAYDNLFRTPLHWAALLGHAKIVHLLLERNKSGMIPSDSQGATPLHYGAQSNYADTVAVFLKHPSVRDEPDLEGRTAFMWAAGKGSDDVIKTMLDLKKDLDINMTDKYGGTALHAAALSGHVSTVRLLLEQGAMVDPLDVMKHTPLFRACEMGHRDVILTLIKGGARVDLVDIDGHSALHWAALGGNAEVCEVLMENGISPNLQDHAGRTPLQCAAYAGYINCMALLIQHDADPNIQDKEGRTALHWSCNNGYLDAVKLLLGCGAFPNHMEHTEERYTPLDYALLGEHQELTQFLLEHGALSIAAIQDIAASSIQALYKGYKVRRAFRERKKLLMRHEQLRKDAAKKREEERRREAEQQLSLAEAGQKKLVSLAEVRVEKLSLDETEQSVKDPAALKGHKHRKSPSAHNIQSQSRREKKHRTERRTRDAETPEASLSLATSGLTVTPLSTRKCSGTVEEECVMETHSLDTCISVGCGSTYERQSPAGSSRPGSAKPVSSGASVASGHIETTTTPKSAAHNRPRTTGAHLKQAALATPRSTEPPTDSIYRSASMGNKPASEHKSNISNSTSVTRQKERRAERETHRDKDSRSRTEGDKQAGREKQKCTGKEKDKERWMGRTRKKQVDKEKEKKRDSIHSKNQAAIVIQRAWRRSCIRGRLHKLLCKTGKGAESAEVTSLLIQLLWGWPISYDHTHHKTSDVQAPPTRNVGKKSSVLQNIYGSTPSKRGPSLQAAVLKPQSQSQALLDLSLKTNKQLSAVECVSLVDTLSQAKQYSYHLRPSSAGSQSGQNRTKN
ncbi:inversin isoform X1 [Carassius gibelio]|uniref:inversin isoform X1 n=1 Tax=Carassius gibelio TaxID=101364 RepID=UPI0022795490|nr:inversin isoform X1 [Carassius gibelio]